MCARHTKYGVPAMSLYAHFLECVKHTKYVVCTSHLLIECRAHLAVCAEHTIHAFVLCTFGVLDTPCTEALPSHMQ